MSYPFIPTPKPFLVKKDNPFTFDLLVAELRKVISKFPDKRTGTNTRYSIEDLALSAFGASKVKTDTSQCYNAIIDTINYDFL